MEEPSIRQARSARIGCCSGILIGIGTLLGLALVVLAFLTLSAYDSNSDDPLIRREFPGSAIPVYVDLSPQPAVALPEPDPEFTVPPYEATGTVAVVRLSDPQLTGLLRRHTPGARLKTITQTGRLLIQGQAADPIQADAWLAPEGGRLRLHLRALVWRGIAVPRPLLGLVSDQMSASLGELFPQSEVAAIEAEPGEMTVFVRPSGAP